MSLRNLVKSISGGEILLPVLRKHALIEYDGLSTGKLSHKAWVQQDAKMTMECFKDRHDTYSHGDRDKGYFHPSQLGRCMRSMWYQERNAPINKAPTGDELLKTQLIFEFGTYIGVLFQNMCERAGVLKGREVLIQCDKSKLEGHADGQLTIDGRDYLLEIKTINSRGFTDLRNGPKEAHKKQMTAYMKVLGLKWAILIYINKDNSLLKEFVVQYDEAYYKAEVAPRVAYWFSVKDSKTPPAREGTNPSAFPCTFCSYSRVCFDSEMAKQFQKKLNNEDKAKTTKTSVRIKVRRNN